MRGRRRAGLRAGASLNESSSWPRLAMLRVRPRLTAAGAETQSTRMCWTVRNRRFATTLSQQRP